VREGRLVFVQRRLGAGDWRTVARTRENARGVVRFRRDAARGSRPYTYRAVATRTRNGLPRVISNAESAAVWDLRFSDRFDARMLNEGKWGYRNLNVRTGSRLHAQSSRSAVHVGRGALTLQVRKHPQRPRRYYLNGHIGTSGKFAFRYGYAAARIKFHKGRGQHGAFWMQPQSPAASYGSAARTGTEIDVAEFFGRGSPKGGMASYVYSYPRPGVSVKSGGLLRSASRALRGRSDSWWSRYHVFSVHWTSSGYIFRIDGVETWRHNAHVSRRPQYLILSLLTSDWELPRLDRSTLPTSMKVDWVRVWQR
jgi:beta-glucanase (GH16 family)